jgi:hypothetical protein
MRSDLRPLTTIELLDAAWLLLRRNWAQFYACSGVGTAPLALLVMVYFIWLGTLLQGTDNTVFYTGTLWWAVGMAVAWMVNSIARGAVTATALADARGETLSFGQAWRQAWRNAAGSAFVGLVGFSAAWVLGSCLVAPGIWLVLGWWTARPALLVEGKPFAAALRRSWRLTDGYRMKALGLWIALVIVWALGVWNSHLMVQFAVGTASGVFGVETSALQGQLRPSNQAYLTFLMVAVFMVLDPLKTAADAMLYLDLRIRRRSRT